MLIKEVKIRKEQRVAIILTPEEAAVIKFIMGEVPIHGRIPGLSKELQKICLPVIMQLFDNIHYNLDAAAGVSIEMTWTPDGVP